MSSKKITKTKTTLCNLAQENILSFLSHIYVGNKLNLYKNSKTGPYNLIQDSYNTIYRKCVVDVYVMSLQDSVTDSEHQYVLGEIIGFTEISIIYVLLKNIVFIDL